MRKFYVKLFFFMNLCNGKEFPVWYKIRIRLQRLMTKNLKTVHLLSVKSKKS